MSKKLMGYKQQCFNFWNLSNEVRRWHNLTGMQIMGTVNFFLLKYELDKVIIQKFMELFEIGKKRHEEQQENEPFKTDSRTLRLTSKF